jgi:tripartite-type tricarboxylate transporter receptor subunit TctC
VSIRLGSVAVIVGGVLALATAAQAYPDRPVRIIVPFAPAGATDIVARVLADALAARLGQSIVVENRPGAAGNIAGDAVAKAPPDGHVLLLGFDGLIAINPHLYARMPFDPLADLAPVASLARNQLVLAVNPAQVPATGLRDFVAFVRRAKPALPYASIGHGSQHHLAMEMLKRRAGIDLLHVPYKGGGPAGLAVVAGEVVAIFAGASIAPLVQSGKLRGLAVSSARRSPLLPDLPTVAEVYPDFDVSVWLGLFAPAGTPEPVLTRLRAEVNAALDLPAVKARLYAAGGLEPFRSTASGFEALIRSDHEKYGRLIREMGLKVN